MVSYDDPADRRQPRICRRSRLRLSAYHACPFHIRSPAAGGYAGERTRPHTGTFLFRCPSDVAGQPRTVQPHPLLAVSGDDLRPA